MISSMAANIVDEDLFKYKDKLQCQTVIITGASGGFGKAAALAFARAGTNVVFGDIDENGAQSTLAEIKALGMEAAFQLCDITSWDNQISLFELALRKFGSINIVVANAGIGEIGQIGVVTVGSDGLPVKPNLKTIDVNLIGSIHTVQLANFYLTKFTNPKFLRSIVVMGSLLSINNCPYITLYGGAKHGILSYMKAIQSDLQEKGIRIALIAPWFAETAIIKGSEALLAGIPMTPISRVASTIVFAATDEAPNSHGSIYALPDDKLSFRLPPDILDLEGTINLCTLLDSRIVQGK